MGEAENGGDLFVWPMSDAVYTALYGASVIQARPKFVRCRSTIQASELGPKAGQ